MKLLRAIFSRRVMTMLGVVAVLLLIWFVGPLIAIATFRPFESGWVRGILIGAVVLFFVGRWAWRVFKAKRADAQLQKSLVAQAEATRPTEPAGAQEVALLRQRFEEAVALLRDTKRKKSGRFSVFGGRFLYELPWYMFIGAPGSGKTTALVNSGLQFPLAERLGYEGVAGIGGTRNCDWWFTDEAVLIDTAGRYTTQESDQQADKAAWTGFLKLLAKYRPRRPINGAIVTISVADLLQQTPAQIEAQAQAIRSRVQELQEQLNVRFPLYVLVSKADLLPGFMEFFGEYGRDERAQVWGTTFPLAEKGETNALADLDVRLTALEARLNERLLDRLQQERDLQKRSLLYTFPQHFGALKQPLSEFLSKVFAPSRYATQPLVRGVYFTSGTQEGTPIDRIMGGLARALKLERKLVAPQRPSGKSFFITRLFTDVIFPEAGLAGTNVRWERQRGVLQWGAFATAALVTIGALVAWGVSYTRNKAYIEEVDARVKGVADQVAALGTRPSSELMEAMPALQAVRDVANSSSIAGGVPLSMRFGLYQGDKLAAAADAAYRGLLQNAFLPRVSMRIEQQLRSRGQQNLELLYEALKAYVMLIDPQRFDAAALKAFLMAEWESSLPRDVTVEQRKELETHLDRLLALGPVSLPVQPDKELVASARDAIARTPISQRIYNRLKHQGTGSDLPEFTIAKASTATAPLVFTRASGQPLTRGVPGFFSFDGYHRVFGKAAEQVTVQLSEEEPWVLGLEQSARSRVADPQGRERLMNEVRRLYLEDYVRVWDRFVGDIRLVRTNDLQQSITVARALSAADSPLPPLLRAIAKEVTLIKSDEAQKAAEKSAVDSATQAIRKRSDDLARMFGAVAAQKGGTAPVRLESIVDDHFAELRRMVRSAPGQPAPIDSATGLMNEIYMHLVATQAAVNSGSPPPPSDLGNKVKAEAGRMPEPVRSMVASLSQGATKQVLDQTRDNLSQSMATTVEEFCRKATEGRYPFAKASTMDVTQDDFSRLFAPGGLLDDFFQKNLAAHVDTTAKPWRFRKVGDASMAEKSESLVQFQRAHAIREAFFRQGKTPSIGLQFKPVSLDPSLAQFTLDVDGQVIKSAPGVQAPPTSVQWPGPKGTQQVRLQTAATSGSAAERLYEGPWALFRLLDRAQVQSTSQPEKLLVTFNVDGRKAQFEVLSASVQNPLRLADLEQFRCPGKL